MTDLDTETLPISLCVGDGDEFNTLEATVEFDPPSLDDADCPEAYGIHSVVVEGIDLMRLLTIEQVEAIRKELCRRSRVECVEAAEMEAYERFMDRVEA